MARSKTSKNCFRHENAATVILCDHCHTPICEACIVHEPEGHESCSFACADKLATQLRELENEKQESKTSRIWTSAFLIFFLTALGTLIGFTFVFLLNITSAHRRTSMNDESTFSTLMITLMVLGGMCGFASSVTFLYRYYTRQLTDELPDGPLMRFTKSLFRLKD